MAHRVYRAIVGAIRARQLQEPFSVEDFRQACPGFGDGTYGAFLYKHRKGNPGKNTELFGRVGTGQFRCLRPFRYGLKFEKLREKFEKWSNPTCRRGSGRTGSTPGGLAGWQARGALGWLEDRSDHEN